MQQQQLRLPAGSRKAFYKMLAMVVLPISLQQLISSSLSLVDNLMIGSLGEAELAAVGLATQFYFIHWMMLFGFSSGCATFMSQFSAPATGKISGR